MKEKSRSKTPEDNKGKEELTRLQRWKKSYGEWRKFKEEDKKEIFKREYTSTIVAKFILPFVLALELSLILYLLFPDIISKIGTLFVLYFFSPLGMEIGVTVGISPEPTGLGLHPIFVVTFMLIIDSLTAMFLIMNFNYSRLLPFFGWLVWTVQSWAGEKIKTSKYFERGSFVGIIIFVLIPLYGTGAILGGIAGKLLEMNPWKHWFAILIGSFIRLSLLAIGTYYGIEILKTIF
jgi:uncharacterized membrane protein